MELNDIIRLKEKELQEIHTLRCTNLESLLCEREEMLVESAKRFEQLREDFQYNLTLIEARDKEIQRFEHLFKNKSLECDSLISEKGRLLELVEAFSTREREVDSKREADKIVNKRIIDDLKVVVDSMKWTNDEELRSKIRDIENLKYEIQTLHIQREESLESQRKDLTNAFEQIINQRENSFNEKERGIAEQIMLLEKRFEQLQTENSRLKSDLSDAYNESSKLSTAISRLEESRSSLQWVLEDERSQKIAVKDAMKREMQKLTLDLSIAKEGAAKRVIELENEIEKINMELTREKDFRSLLERRVEEMRAVTQQDLSVLERELGDCRNHDSLLQRELDSMREERDIALHRAASARLELDSIDASSRVLSKDKEALNTEVQLLKINLSEKDELINTLRSDIAEKNKRMSETSEIANKKLIEAKSEAVRELEMLTQAKASIINDHLRTIDELQRELNQKISENNDERTQFQLQMAAKEKNYEELNEQLVSVRQTLQEEKTEAAALRLRLKLYESNQQQQPQPPSLQLRVPQRRVQQTQEPEQQSNRFQRQQGQLSQLKGEDGDEDDEGLDHAVNRRDQNHRNQLLSPAFSEDLGPASFSSSMLLMPLSPPQSPHRHNNKDFNTMSSSESPVGFSGIATQASYNRNRDVAVRKRQVFDNDKEMDERQQQDSRPVEDRRITALLEENDRLKKVVREMRQDVEDLKHPMKLANEHLEPVPPFPPANTTVATATQAQQPVKQESFDILERRLKQTVDEVSRLRNDRRKLMDVSNELRAALFQKTNADSKSSFSYPVLPSYMESPLRIQPPQPSQLYSQEPPDSYSPRNRHPTQSSGSLLWGTIPTALSNASTMHRQYPIRDDNYSSNKDSREFLSQTVDNAFNTLSLKGQSYANNTNTANNEEKPVFTVSAANSNVRATSSTGQSRSRLSTRSTAARKTGNSNNNVNSSSIGKVANPRVVMNYAKKPDEFED